MLDSPHSRDPIPKCTDRRKLSLMGHRRSHTSDAFGDACIATFLEWRSAGLVNSRDRELDDEMRVVAIVICGEKARQVK